jgi:hypothetical protein
MNDHLGVSKATVCQAIKEVTGIINRRLSDIIKWPDDPNELRAISHAFQQMTDNGIPNVCGLGIVKSEILIQ